MNSQFSYNHCDCKYMHINPLFIWVWQFLCEGIVDIPHKHVNLRELICILHANIISLN